MYFEHKKAIKSVPTHCLPPPTNCKFSLTSFPMPDIPSSHFCIGYGPNFGQKMDFWARHFDKCRERHSVEWSPGLLIGMQSKTVTN